MDKAQIISTLTRLRQATIADRTQKKQEKKFVEESKRPLLSLRKKGAHVVLSGDSESVKKLQKAAPILEFLQEILQKNADTIESPEFVTDHVEDPVYKYDIYSDHQNHQIQQNREIGQNHQIHQIHQYHQFPSATLSPSFGLIQ